MAINLRGVPRPEEAASPESEYRLGRALDVPDFGIYELFASYNGATRSGVG
jgi:hypothetical protein